MAFFFRWLRLCGPLVVVDEIMGLMRGEVATLLCPQEFSLIDTPDQAENQKKLRGLGGLFCGREESDSSPHNFFSLQIC